MIIHEAQALTPLEKMKLLNGGAKRNIGAMSDQKLFDNQKICINNNLSVALDAIETEMLARKLISKKTNLNTTPTNIDLSSLIPDGTDFSDLKVERFKKLISDKDKWSIVVSSVNTAVSLRLRSYIALLVMAIVAKKSAQANELVDSLVKKGVAKQDIKNLLNNISSDSDITKQLIKLQQEKLEFRALDNIVDGIHINGPAYRGADYPPDDLLKINERLMPDNMRPKSVDLNITGLGTTIRINWETQEPFSSLDAKESFKEIKRAVVAIAEHIKYCGRSFNLTVDFAPKGEDNSITLTELLGGWNQNNDLSVNEDFDIESTTPYMLRNDGALLQCGEIHPYIKQWITASVEDNIKKLVSNVENINWFIKNTLDNNTKQVLLQLKTRLQENNIDEIEDIFEEANNLTNQEFCRVRTSNYKYKYGGDNGEIYFRLNSIGFNWFPLIWEVVNKFKNKIKFVTIMSDEIIRGHKLDFARYGKYVFNKMPVDEFLSLEGNPIIENFSNTNEDIEKHDTLNPKLFNEDETLKQEVLDKLNLIVEEFVNDLKENSIDIDIKDVIITGSNASYNYTKDSDIDLHILADMSKYSEADKEKTMATLYDAYRKIWKYKYSIKFYDIPVEIFVETV